MKQVKHNEWLREQLKDPGFSAEYLTAAAEDEEPAVFLRPLRKVAVAQVLASLANPGGIHRERKSFPLRDRPEWHTPS